MRHADALGRAINNSLHFKHPEDNIRARDGINDKLRDTWQPYRSTKNYDRVTVSYQSSFLAFNSISLTGWKSKEIE